MKFLDKLHIFSFEVSKNYAVDICLFHQIRQFSDGITFLNFEINSDFYEGDHNPQHCIKLEFLNMTIFSIEVYNTNHHNGKVLVNGEWVECSDEFQKCVDEIDKKLDK